MSVLFLDANRFFLLFLSGFLKQACPLDDGTCSSLMFSMLESTLIVLLVTLQLTLNLLSLLVVDCANDDIVFTGALVTLLAQSTNASMFIISFLG